MRFLLRICALLCFLTVYSLAAIGEDTIIKHTMPTQKGRLSTPDDRDNFAREHPTPPSSGEIPFRPTEGLEKYKADQAAAQAIRDARLRSKSKETRLDTLRKIDKKIRYLGHEPKIAQCLSTTTRRI